MLPTVNPAVISSGKIYRHQCKQIHFSNQTLLTEHLFWEYNKHFNHSIVVIFGLCTGNQTLCALTVISLKYVFHLQSARLDSRACLGIHSSVFFAPPDGANIVSESTEIVDVSPSITTNIIGQKTDEMGSDMCERSCEELSTMFQELKGLRLVVSNLIDGLQKVVSSRSDTV